MKAFFLQTIFLLFIQISFAQKGKIEGTVTDAKTGLPLTGVSVIIKDTKKGTSSDIQGHYIINVDTVQKTTLIFTYGGATLQVDEIEIDRKSVV